MTTGAELAGVANRFGYLPGEEFRRPVDGGRWIDDASDYWDTLRHTGGHTLELLQREHAEGGDWYWVHTAADGQVQTGSTVTELEACLARLHGPAHE
jgi:hypothetical protein